MIYKSPLPLFEANLFLANRALGFKWKDYIEKMLKGDPKNEANAQLREYGHVLTELESKLESSISVSESVLGSLFCPIRKNEKDPETYSDYYIGHLIIPEEIDTFAIRDNSEFMKRIRENIYLIPYAIAERITGESMAPSEKIDIRRLFKLINESDLAPESKLLLTDLATDSEKYVDMLEQALLPVADEFRRCSELMRPLLDAYRDDYKEKTAESVLCKLYGNTTGDVSDFLMYPLVISSQYNYITFDKAEPLRMMGCVSVMHKFLRSNYVLNNNGEINLSSMMAAMSNKNRFDIVERLLTGPVYGRELASYLNLSPSTVSMHINILVSAGIVMAHNEGARAYYSLNTYTVRRVIERLNTFFAPALKDDASE